MRLKHIAAVRAATTATTIQNSVPTPGTPHAATSMEIRANGSAKTECENLIISRKVRVRRRRDIPGLSAGRNGQSMRG
ncbi:MAG: hypothetical protein PWP23_2166 [Candidatus Sumerlaeota bacterium]|nr:hypothetical protein [Candidatus Sumerlaeota bacterium]